MSARLQLMSQAAKRAKSDAFTTEDGYAAQLFQEEDVEGPLVTRNMFTSLRRDTIDDAISDAGSDDEELLVTEDVEPQPPAPPVGEVDELTLLLDDTPLKRLRAREKDAQKVCQAGDLWLCLKLRMEVLAIAKLYSGSGPYASENKFPMLLADAHFKLAKAYAALQCIPQTSDHCNRALDAMPLFGLSNDRVVSFKREVNILLGEALLAASPPKPQVALQYFCAAEGCSGAEGIKDSGLRVLAAQCLSFLGVSKLQEANATRNAEEALKQRVEAMTSKLKATDSKSPEYGRLLKIIDETRNELQEEANFEQILIDEARSQLDKATDILMFVIDEEEQRLRKKMGDDERKKHPLIQTLWRRACEILFKMALLEGAAGRVKAQLGHLDNVIGIGEGYGCLSSGLLACTLKEKGACLVAQATTQSDGEQRNADLKTALETYDKLLSLQIHRYPDDSAKQATSRAEAVKLIGNVYVALRQWNRAKEHFKEALELYSSYLGPTSTLVSDLESRIAEVQSYVDE